MLTCLIFSSNRTEPEDILIPCECCGVPISMHDLTWHTVNKQYSFHAYRKTPSLLWYSNNVLRLRNND